MIVTLLVGNSNVYLTTDKCPTVTCVDGVWEADLSKGMTITSANRISIQLVEDEASMVDN